MGEVERLHRAFNRTLSPEETKERVHELKREIREEWSRFKIHGRIMQGEEIEDNLLDCLLLFFVKKGIL
jgi:hypothetical protein